MASFETAMDFVLANEGGYVNDPSDRGGETRYGISKRSYPSLDIQNLTRDQAIGIYKRDYWRYDQIRDQAVATKLFDMAVLTSPKRAVQLFQSSICACGHIMPVDGLWGPRTIAAANAIPPKELLETFITEVKNYLGRLILQVPADAKFYHGWCNRIEKQVVNA